MMEAFGLLETVETCGEIFQPCMNSHSVLLDITNKNVD
jgi:hypothetical protein